MNKIQIGGYTRILEERSIKEAPPLCGVFLYKEV